VLTVDKLPALGADQDYQLWVVDPQYANPVDGGVFTVDPQSGAARVISSPATSRWPRSPRFAVTLERKGGVPKAEGPFVLLGKWPRRPPAAGEIFISTRYPRAPRSSTAHDHQAEGSWFRLRHRRTPRAAPPTCRSGSTT
jgi:hypothetical protein